MAIRDGAATLRLLFPTLSLDFSPNTSNSRYSDLLKRFSDCDGCDWCTCHKFACAQTEGRGREKELRASVCVRRSGGRHGGGACRDSVLDAKQKAAEMPKEVAVKVRREAKERKRRWNAALIRGRGRTPSARRRATTAPTHPQREQQQRQHVTKSQTTVHCSDRGVPHRTRGNGGTEAATAADWLCD